MVGLLSPAKKLRHAFGSGARFQRAPHQSELVFCGRKKSSIDASGKGVKIRSRTLIYRVELLAAGVRDKIATKCLSGIVIKNLRCCGGFPFMRQKKRPDTRSGLLTKLNYKKALRTDAHAVERSEYEEQSDNEENRADPDRHIVR